MKYYSAIKNNEIMLFSRKQMELVLIFLSEVSQTQKDKHCIFPFICRILGEKRHRCRR
jgi:hypothetical protein